MPADYFQPDVVGYLNLTTRNFTLTTNGGPFSWPDLIEGDTLNVSLKFLREVDGAKLLVDREIRSLKASIGLVDARPTSGSFQILVGDPEADRVEGLNVTAPISYAATAATWEAALNALAIIGSSSSSESSLSSGVETYGAATVELVNGNYEIEFAGETEAVPLAVVGNTLKPVSFVRIRANENDAGDWIHSARLLRAPLAFTNATARAVPSPPKISTLVNGSSDEAGNLVNEVQVLTIDPLFEGTYRIRRGLKRSRLLSRADRPAAIAAAINPVSESDLRLGDDVESVLTVTQDAFGSARIEFSGSMEGLNVDPMTIEVVSAPPGNHSFSLRLDKALLAAALAEQDELEVPFEVQVEFADLNIEDEYSKVTFRTDVTLNRELIWSELAEIDGTDWERPSVRVDYVPSDFTEIEVGVASFPFSIGGSTSAVIDHDLGSHFTLFRLRDNRVAAKFLVEGVDYTLDRTTGENSTGITLIGDYDPAPGAATIDGIAWSLGKGSKYSPHNQAIETITGESGDLREILDAIAAEIALLKAQAVGGPPLALPLPGSSPISWALPPLVTLVPLRNPNQLAGLELPAELALIDGSALPRPAGLRPAVHDAEAATLPLPVPDPAAEYVGNVYQWNGSADSSGYVELLKLQGGDYVACDGEAWYRVERFTSPPVLSSSSSSESSASSASSASSESSTPEASYYPAAMTTTLFEFAVNEKQLRRRKTLNFAAGLELRTVRDPSGRRPRERDTELYCALVVEIGEFTADESPAGVGKNLKDVVWRPVPAFELPLVITPTPQVHTFGLRATRSAVDALKLEALIYGDLEAAAVESKPSGFNFAVRARLVRFDTKNAISDPRGFLALSGFARVGEGANGSGTALGFVTVS